jgi:hypothetical protein
MPTLWSNIIVTNARIYSPYIHPSRSDFTEGEICKNITELNTILHRAGVVPLTIRLPNLAPMFCSKQGLELFHQIINVNMSHRITSLTLGSLSGRTFDIDLSPKIRFPALHGLVIDGRTWVHGFLVRYIDNVEVSPNLRELSLLYDLDIGYDWSLSPLLPRLRRLYFRRCYSSQHEKILALSQSLRSLNVGAAIWPSTNFPVTRYGNLRILATNCTDLRAFSRLEFPVLEELRLINNFPKEVGNPIMAPDYNITLPRLTRLIIRVAPLSLLAAFSTPVLEELRLTTFSSFSRQDDDCFRLFENLPPFSFVRIVHLRTWASGNGIMEVVKNTPVVEELHITPGRRKHHIDYAGPFLEQLGARLAGDIFLPKLRRIAFSGVREGRNRLDPTKLRGLIDRRRELGVPLEINVLDFDNDPIQAAFISSRQVDILHSI